MFKTIKINAALFILVSFYSYITGAQVPVSKEPHHKKVIANKYIRLLDVWIKPGDTTQFHIHATASLFLQFTSTANTSQIKGKQEWEKDRNEEGKAYYRSFFKDTLVHRVSNCDKITFHVTDIELLSAYKPQDSIQPLAFKVLFNNEKAIAYRLTSSSFNTQVISNRGPIIAELVKGEAVRVYDAIRKNSTRIRSGKYLFIEPGSSFYFIPEGKEEINMVLFEIK